MAHMLERIGFLDETWLKTKVAKRVGWALCGERLVRSRTIRVLAHTNLCCRVASWSVGCVLGHQLHYEQCDVRRLRRNPTCANLKQRLCNHPIHILSSHKSACAAEILHDVDTWFLFLPPYSPDRNGVLKPQVLNPKGRRPNPRRPLTRHLHRLQPLLWRRILQLPQSHRILNRLTANRYSGFYLK